MVRPGIRGTAMSEWPEIKIPLAHPIKVGELSLTEIIMREPDVAAMEVIEEQGFQEGVKPTLKQLRAAIGALAKQPVEILNQIHRDDFTKLAEAAVPLIGGASESSPAPGSEAPNDGTSLSATLPTISAPPTQTS